MISEIDDYFAKGCGRCARFDTKNCSTRLDLPDELVEALDSDPELSEAFHALTRGRRNSYVIAINSAKKPETRVARIGKFRDRILAGKGALER